MDRTNKILLGRTLNFLHQFDVIVFDLDHTLLNINLGNMGFYSAKQIKLQSQKQDLKKYVNDYYFIKLLLINLRMQDKKTAILTHSERTIAREFLKQVELYNFFSNIISSIINNRLVDKSLFIHDINNEWQLKYGRKPNIIFFDDNAQNFINMPQNITCIHTPNGLSAHLFGQLTQIY